MVDSIMANLRRPAPHLQKAKRPSLSPDALMNSLKPLLGLSESRTVQLWLGLMQGRVDPLGDIASSSPLISDKNVTPISFKISCSSCSFRFLNLELISSSCKFFISLFVCLLRARFTSLCCTLILHIVNLHNPLSPVCADIYERVYCKQ